MAKPQSINKNEYTFNDIVHIIINYINTLYQQYDTFVLLFDIQLSINLLKDFID